MISKPPIRISERLKEKFLRYVYLLSAMQVEVLTVYVGVDDLGIVEECYASNKETI